MDGHYVQDHPSPTKKRRVDPQVASSSSHPPPQAPQQLFTLPGLAVNGGSYQQAPTTPPLRPLPPLVSLLALASSLRQTALSLLPSLAKRPSTSGQSSQARYAYAFNAYAQAKAGEVAALRAACSLAAASGEYRGGRMELRARAMVAEVLVEQIEEGQGTQGEGEAEEMLSKALSIAQSHPSLTPFLPPLQLLQLRLSLASHKPHKHTRQLLRRLLSSLPAPSPASSAAQAGAWYHAQAVAASLPAHAESDTSVAESASAWRALAEAAAERGDGEVQTLARVAEARLALEAEDYARVSSLVSALEPALGTEAGAGPRWREAKILFKVLKVVLLAQKGQVKEAKDALKETHRLLDAPVTLEAGEVEGVCQAVIRPPTSTSSTSTSLPAAAAQATFSLRLPPHSLLYPLVFHLSTALHLDPLGRSPRSLLFGEEGLKLLSARLNARDAPPSPSSIGSLSSVAAELKTLAGIKVALHLSVARLRTMKGEYAEAEGEIEGAVRTATQYGMWESAGGKEKEVKEAVVLAWGLNRLARCARGGEDEKEAERALEAVAFSSSSSSSSTPTASASSFSQKAAALSPRRSHTRLLASLSLLLLRLSRSQPLPSLPPLPVQPSAPASLAAILAQALTAKEITAQKTALSAALTAANGSQANWVRAGVLGVLGVVFAWTREGEAQKMLLSSYKLSSSMGPPSRLVALPSSSSAQPSSASSSSSIFPGAAAADVLGQGGEGTKDGKVQVQVGSARLQKWAGERLLDSLRASPSTLATPAGRQQVQELERAVEACGVWLAQGEAAVGGR
ncbi:hypothetical protein JCM10213_005876 [Rhodosporidiobolus nylandii]